MQFLHCNGGKVSQMPLKDKADNSIIIFICAQALSLITLICLSPIISDHKFLIAIFAFPNILSWFLYSVVTRRALVFYGFMIDKSQSWFKYYIMTITWGILSFFSLAYILKKIFYMYSKN